MKAVGRLVAMRKLPLPEAHLLTRRKLYRSAVLSAVVQHSRLCRQDKGVRIVMAIEKIRVGIIGARMHNGWGREAHIPALSALPEFEITAVSTSRQETADETAKHFGIPHAFADPYRMVQHPDVDLVSI
jgi:hypothetical protein